ncbi:phosphoribosylformylglycinamidine synthase subunit PurL [Candidatus Peregrinibacteria bacterium]|nr:phosphoribosylformylglycinamidine synthase subunit PurL [Candidatus Peregrinibacteria bacterium]
MKLDQEERRRICAILDRDPTTTEETIFAIQWSEHCSYKSSKRFLKTLPTASPQTILGPGQDSGIVAITDAPKGKRWGLIISHESHNHPSQIVPYEGAATGIGGVVRDVLCMGGRVIGCLDMLRFGDGKSEESRTIIRDIVRGIGGYGNPIGVPNLGGSTLFDKHYDKNCLVNAVAIGLVREDHIVSSFTPKEAGRIGYDIILVGKATDRSGFGGATFASVSLLNTEKKANRSAVQEPNPFLERHMMAAFYELFEWLQNEKYIHKISCKDLGAGGIVCATVEQVAAEGLGAEIELTRIHTAYPDLPPEVIACAETQERMCVICHPDLTSHILRHFNETWELPLMAENARASVIGKVTDDGIYHLTYKGETVCKAKSMDITCGIEYGEKERPACHPEKNSSHHDISLEKQFMHTLDDPNNCSKEPLFIHFDKNVIGNTIFEPGEADAAVIAPLQDENDWTGVALACAGPLDHDPYQQGRKAASQALQKIIAVGATPRALTDCLNFGNPEVPDQLWQLQEGVRGLCDAAHELKIPFISGNVSLYNCADDGVSIPPTATVCCIGILPNAHHAISMNFKKHNSHIAIVHLDHLEKISSLFSTILPQILSAHVVTNGLLMALLEMTTPKRGYGGTIGLSVHVDNDLLVSSSGILIETASPIVYPGILSIGHTLEDPLFIVKTGSQSPLSFPLPVLHQQWKKGITEGFFAVK